MMESLPSVYLEQRKASMRFEKAVVYYLNPIVVDPPFFDSSGGPFDTTPTECWLELYDENGIVGQAPCGPLMESVILPLIMNGQTLPYEQWYNKLYWKLRNNGFSGEAINELGRLDLALHDLMAKRAQLPLHRLLGADRDWAKVYASGCGTNLTIQQMEKEVACFLDGGYDCMKMKIATNFGTQLDRDVERIRIVREMIGPDRRLAIDANQIWTADEAMAFFDRVSQYNLAWFEEPVHSHNFRELRKITKRCPVPVGMGESVKNYYMLEAYVDCGVGQLQPIPTNQCSVMDWLKGRDLAYRSGIEFTAGGISHLTASYVASGREEDMVEYLYPIMHPLRPWMKRVPEEKDGKFILDTLPGAALEPDIPRMIQKGLVAHTEYFRSH